MYWWMKKKYKMNGKHRRGLEKSMGWMDNVIYLYEYIQFSHKKKEENPRGLPVTMAE